MVVNITIRDVPPNVRDEISRRATQEGQSMQEYLWQLLSRHAKVPAQAEILARIDQQISEMPEVDLESLLQRSDDGRY